MYHGIQQRFSPEFRTTPLSRELRLAHHVNMLNVDGFSVLVVFRAEGGMLSLLLERSSKALGYDCGVVLEMENTSPSYIGSTYDQA